MSDLHLTDEEVKELPGMGPFGEDAAYALWLWGECPAAPWDGISIASIFRTEFDKNEPTSAFDAVEATICHTRNTAQLRAALVYWWMKMGVAFNAKLSAEINECKKKVHAIDQALKEMRP